MTDYLTPFGLACAAVIIVELCYLCFAVSVLMLRSRSHD